MPRERSLWSTVRRRLSPYGRLVRFESPATPGAPDVYYRFPAAGGWLELKRLETWPKRPETNVAVPSLTSEQVNWLLDETRAGGQAHLLLQVGTTYLLLNPLTVRALHRKTLRRRDLEEVALVRGVRALPTLAIVQHLTRNAERRTSFRLPERVTAVD